MSNDASTTGPARYRYSDLPRLMALLSGDEKHEPSAISIVDVLWVLYDRVLQIDPTNPRAEQRDRFLLSRGHGAIALYAVLAAKGFISEDTLRGFGRFDSPLGSHPDRTLVPGVEISSGSLGHGLPLAIGVALALRARRNARSRVFCLLGDGELDEGTNHEAIVAANRFGLDRLTSIVIDNQSASLGWPGGIASRFEAEGWSTSTVDGRDHAALESALSREHPGRPLVLVAVVEGR